MNPQFGPDTTFASKETEAQSSGRHKVQKESAYIERHRTSVEVMEPKGGLGGRKQPGSAGWRSQELSDPWLCSPAVWDPGQSPLSARSSVKGSNINANLTENC